MILTSKIAINNDRGSILFPFLLILSLFYFLASSYCWIKIFVPKLHYFLIFYDALFILYILKINVGSLTTKTIRPLIFLFLITGFTIVSENNYLIALTTFLTYLPAFLLWLLPDIQKKQMLSFITKWFSIILLISLGMFFVTSVTTMPSIGKYDSGNSFYPIFKNYVFYLESPALYGTYRFNGPFLEPGHMAIIIAFLLFANNYDFRNNKYLYILSAALIFSFSLAGWMLTLIGWVLLNLRKIKILIPSIIILGTAYWISTSIDNGNNLVNAMIISRLEFDKDKGIKGNNRFAQGTDILYDKMFKDGSIWQGKGSTFKRADIAGAGYKIYFIRQGVLMGLLVLVYYISLGSYYPDKRYTICFLIVLMACFLSRGYPMWYSWLLPFVLGTSLHNSYLKLTSKEL